MVAVGSTENAPGQCMPKLTKSGVSAHCLPSADRQKVVSCPTLCEPMDWSSPGSSVHAILQARILDWVAISFSRGSSCPGIKPGSPILQAVSCTTGGFFTN